MTGEKYSKVHLIGSKQLEVRAGIQTMGFLPMVMVQSLIMYLYVNFLFLCWFHRHGVPHKNVCVVSVGKIFVWNLWICHWILLESCVPYEAIDPAALPKAGSASG